ncbi:hypothetical protein D3C71_1471710 [compost metagenome]
MSSLRGSVPNWALFHWVSQPGSITDSDSPLGCICVRRRPLSIWPWRSSTCRPKLSISASIAAPHIPLPTGIPLSTGTCRRLSARATLNAQPPIFCSCVSVTSTIALPRARIGFTAKNSLIDLLRCRPVGRTECAMMTAQARGVEREARDAVVKA